MKSRQTAFFFLIASIALNLAPAALAETAADCYRSQTYEQRRNPFNLARCKSLEFQEHIDAKRNRDAEDFRDKERYYREQQLHNIEIERRNLELERLRLQNERLRQQAEQYSTEKTIDHTKLDEPIGTNYTPEEREYLKSLTSEIDESRNSQIIE